LLREEIIKDLSKLILAINIVTIFLNSIMSVNARYKRLKEHFINSSNQVRKSRENIGTLFSITHFTAFLKYTCGHFSETINRPFDFIRALRIYSPVPLNLDKHLLTFLKYIKSPNKLMEFTVPIITSSIFLDSYLPKVYSKYSLL
jgi:hypothetical protein